jgi:hypothetical protein
MPRRSRTGHGPLKATLLVAACLLHGGAAPAAEHQYLQLQDKLDRPVDGYCLDVVGSGDHVRFDMPLTAHNCKGPQVFFDEVVQFRADGTLYFPAYDLCVTVMGNNATALPKNALMLKGCGAREPFLTAKHLQHFEWTEEQRVRLKGSDLCIVAGSVSQDTFSPDHRWRSLYVEVCSQAAPALSRWQLIPAGVKQPESSRE